MSIWIVHVNDEQDQSQKTGQASRTPEFVKDGPGISIRRPFGDSSVCQQATTEKEYELCQAWRSADAARQSAYGTWSQVGIGAIALLGLWLTVRYTKRAAEAASNAAAASRDQLNLAHPPKIIVTLVAANPVGRRDDPIVLAAGEEIEGVVAVISAGRGVARITQAFCLPFWHSGQLPMWRPYDNNGRKGRDTFGALTVDSRPGVAVTDLASGEMAVWKFIHKIPATYASGQDFYILGQIAYGDPANHGWHTVLFARKYDPSKNRFVPVDDPNYENAY